MMSLYSNGLVTRDKTTAGIKTSISTTAKNKIETIGNTIGDIWKKGTSAISSALDKLKNAVGIETKNKTTDASMESSEEGGQGGRGSFYSQNDPRWKNSSYGSDATMGDSGCGPTAVAMAMSDATGKKFSPMQMADLAQATGDRDATGTNWNFVNNAAALAGVPSRQVYSPSANYIGSELAAGNELILSGRTGGYGRRGGYGSAYTPAGHYIVGTGIDRNGIVSYKDPTTGGMGRIPLSLLSSETGSSWKLGGRGPIAEGMNDYDYAQAEKFSQKNKNASAEKQSQYEATISGESAASSSNSEIDWIGAVKTAKKAIADTQQGYKMGGRREVSVNGKTYHIRPDCSGMVAFALRLAGLLESNDYASNNYNSGFGSSSFVDGSFKSKLTDPNFFSLVHPSNIGDLQLGDILAYNGHVEVFAEPSNGKTSYKFKVYNCGSNDSANNPDMTNSGHTWNQIKAVYRPNSVGAGNLTGETESGGTSISGKSSMSAWDKITGAVSDFFGEAFNRLLTGNKSTDYSDIWNKYRDTDEEGNPVVGTGYDSYKSTFGTTGSTTGETESGAVTSTFTGGTVKSFNVATGSTANKSTIYQFLRSKGLSPQAAAGVMGNWAVESSNDPNRFEADYTGFAQSMGGLNGIFRDSSSLNTFTQKLFDNYKSNGKSINQKGYLGTDGNYYPGLGLAQWTGPRGQQLMEYADARGSSWNDANTQLDFFMNGPSEFNSKSGLMDKMNSAKTPTDAANTFFDYFEMNKPGYNQSAPSWVNIDKRRSGAEAIYNEFGGSGRGISIHNRQYVPTAKRPSTGGRGLSFTTSTTGYNGPEYSTVYGNKQAASSTEKLMYQIIDIITNIANIESGASDKLDLLNNIGNTSNNVIVAGNGGGDQTSLKTASQHMGNQASSRNFKQAHRMAMQRESVNI